MYALGTKSALTRIWANAKRDGRPAYRWRLLFNAIKFG